MPSDKLHINPLFHPLVDMILGQKEIELNGEFLKEIRIILSDSRNQLLSIERELSNLNLKNEEIKRANKNFLKLYNFAPVGYLTIDSTGKIISINVTGASLLGQLQISLIGDNIFKYFPLEDGQIFREKLSLSIASGEGFKQDLRMKRSNETLMHASIEGEVTSVHEGFINIVISDITVRKISELALRRSEGWFRATIDAVSEMLVVVNSEMTVLLCNESFRRQLSRLKIYREPVGENIIELCPFFGDSEKNEYQWVFETGKSINSRLEYSGEEYNLFLDSRKIPIFDDQGQIIQTLSVMNDITERVIATHSNAEKEVYLKGIIENANDIIFSFNLDGVINYISPAFSRILGRSVREFEGRKLTELVHLQDTENMESSLNRLFNDYEHVRDLKVRISAKDGQWLWFLVSMSLVRNLQGSFAYAVGVATDINAIISYQKALEDSRRSYKDLWESQGEGAGFLDSSEVFIHVNPYGEKIFGMDPGTLAGRSLLEFVELEYQDKLITETSRRKKGESSTYELAIHRKDNETRILLLTATPKFDEFDGTFLGTFVIFRDITSRKQLENELKKSEERHRQLFENNAAVQLIVKVEDTTIFDANPAAANFYGYTRDELRNMSMTQINGLTREQVKEFFRQRLDGEKIIFNIRHLLKSGEWRDVEVKTSPVYIDHDLYIHSIITDITERRITGEKNASLERMLIHSQRMEVFGNIAKSLTNEFSEILSEVSKNNAALRDKNKKPEKASVEIDSLVEKGKKLINHILMFGSNLPFELQKWKLIPFIERLKPILSNICGSTTGIDYNLSGDGNVFLDSILMEQVIVNIVTASRDSMPQGGTITLELGMISLDKDAKSLGISPGDYVKITIGDNNINSIEDGLEKQIFEPFLTSKRVKSSSTVLGLITVHGIMQQHLGAVEITNKNSKSYVNLYLPLVEETDNCVRDGYSPSILIVDDEEGIRAVTRKILEMDQMQVMEASSGEDALKFIDIHKPRLDLIIIDMVLPGMTGNILGEEIKRLYPDVPLLFISGYPESMMSRYGVDEKGVNFLAKPFSVKQFREEVTAILNR
ncbi:MAG: PAS domain S-box protein [Deltaproteobacteria bacterium]|nr:PAS domain S-box protein [Deltaproteobacteria bacterium]